MYAARENLTMGGKPVPKLMVRLPLQLVFIGSVLLASPMFG
ncbi:hypothetical protein [Paenibacillus physcomitrellae]|nr:hypothetical protein [Paenibacillus physcomitrellae]